MKKASLKTCVSAASIAVMSLVAMPAHAQEAPADEATVGALDEIVVTASGRDKTQLNTSVSVTSVGADLIEAMKPSSEAEVFRLSCRINGQRERLKWIDFYFEKRRKELCRE